MSYSISLQTPLSFGYYFRGYNGSGSTIALIGVDALGRVAVDPNGIGADIGGNVLFINPAAYLNWDTTIGAGGYGIRGNAGTVEFKNSAGAWAPIAAAAASAGGWTDDGTVVRLDTGTDQVGIGTVSPVTGSKLHISATDGGQRFFVNGTTKGLRVGFDSAQSLIEGVDSTGVASYQPLLLGGSTLKVELSGASRTEWQVSGLVINELGADYDFRIESDTNASHFVVDAGVLGGVGGFGFGQAASGSAYVSIGEPATTAAAGVSHGVLRINPVALTIPTGNAPTIACAWLNAPTLTLVGTAGDAYTLYIADAPVGASRNGAIWVASGQVRLSGLPTSAAGLPSGTLWNSAGVVNVAP